MTNESAFVRAYARALFGAARARDARAAVARDLAALLGALAESSELRRWISRRVLSSAPRRAAEVNARFGKLVGPATMRLLTQMAAWNHLHLIPAVARRYEALLRAEEGRRTAHATFVQPPTETALAALRARLDADANRLDLEIHADPALLAGLTVRIEDRILDASLAGRLARLRRALAAPAMHASANA